MLDTSSAIAERVAAAIKKSGLTHAQIAEKLGITPGAVSQWATKRTAPSAAKLDALAVVLRIDPWFLRTGELDPSLEIDLFGRSNFGTIARNLDPAHCVLSERHFLLR